MKLSTIAAIGLPLLGIAMLLILIATLTEKPVRRYVNPEVERAYETLKSPEEQAAFDRTIQDYVEMVNRESQLIKEQLAENKAEAVILGYHEETEEQRAERYKQQQAAADFAAQASVHQIEEQAQAEQAATTAPTASITVVSGPMTPEQIHALINGPK